MDVFVRCPYCEVSNCDYALRNDKPIIVCGNCGAFRPIKLVGALWFKDEKQSEQEAALVEK